jgi:hypothetical protein
MNTASLELCKELYELSGWDDTYLRHWVNAKSGPSVDHAVAIFGYGKRKDTTIEAYPAYDLGYLLRKLPDGTQLNKTTVSYSASGIYSVDGHNKSFHEYADTSEDAACKLAIKLIKTGVIQGGSDE